MMLVMENEWLAHYRRRSDGSWCLYRDGKIVAFVRDARSDALVRFPSKRIVEHGSVNLDVAS